MNYLKYCAFYKVEDCIYSTPDIVNSSAITIWILCPFSFDQEFDYVLPGFLNFKLGFTMFCYFREGTGKGTLPEF